MTQQMFCAPHHTESDAGLLGGTVNPLHQPTVVNFSFVALLVMLAGQVVARWREGTGGALVRGDGWLCRPQCDGDLGQRMAGAFADSLHEGSTATVIIGSDCPSLTPAVLAGAFESLKVNPVVFGPATDGGYYLIGWTQRVPKLFQGVAWGTETVLAQSLEILARTDSQPALLSPLDDLDRPEDVAAGLNVAKVEEGDLTQVSVIIPALNEAGQIQKTIESARVSESHEILVVDGGGTDDTVKLARKSGATIIHPPPVAPGR